MDAKQPNKNSTAPQKLIQHSFFISTGAVEVIKFAIFENKEPPWVNGLFFGPGLEMFRWHIKYCGHLLTTTFKYRLR